jgi:hypothetical protein
MALRCAVKLWVRLRKPGRARRCIVADLARVDLFQRGYRRNCDHDASATANKISAVQCLFMDKPPMATPATVESVVRDRRGPAPGGCSPSLPPGRTGIASGFSVPSGGLSLLPWHRGSRAAIEKSRSQYTERPSGFKMPLGIKRSQPPVLMNHDAGTRPWRVGMRLPNAEHAKRCTIDTNLTRSVLF